GDCPLADGVSFAVCPTIEQAWHQLSCGIDLSPCVFHCFAHRERRLCSIDPFLKLSPIDAGLGYHAQATYLPSPVAKGRIEHARLFSMGQALLLFPQGGLKGGERMQASP